MAAWQQGPKKTASDFHPTKRHWKVEMMLKGVLTTLSYYCKVHTTSHGLLAKKLLCEYCPCKSYFIIAYFNLFCIKNSMSLVGMGKPWYYFVAAPFVFRFSWMLLHLKLCKCSATICLATFFWKNISWTIFWYKCFNLPSFLGNHLNLLRGFHGTANYFS